MCGSLCGYSALAYIMLHGISAYIFNSDYCGLMDSLNFGIPSFLKTSVVEEMTKVASF